MRAVVFDLDGTLVDSLEDIAVALDRALDDHGLARPTRETVRTWVGGGARNLIEHAAPPALVDPVLASFRAHYGAALVVHTRLYPGIPALLDRLASAGMRLAVLSNKPHAMTVHVGEALLGRWPFAAIAGHRAPYPLKPAPDAALALLRELDVAPADGAFVGDSAVDILTARAAGMLPVGVSWGFRPRAELVAAQAAHVVDTPAELAFLAT